MAARENTAVICSIAFVEIVDYARKPVEAQMRAKDQFKGLVRRSLAGVPAAERIVLDTAEGVAISFLANTEACLAFVLALRDALAAEGDAVPPLRVGINAGPVRLVKDPNGQPNLIGDGMSVGQRIVDFAQANQILASGAFHDALSKLDPDYARLFDFAGTRTDAQVREHALYALNQHPAPARALRPQGPEPAHSSASGTRSALAALSAPLLDRPPLATALAVALILITAVALRLTLHGTNDAPQVPAVAEAPARAPSAVTMQPAPERMARPEPTAPSPQGGAEPTSPTRRPAPAARSREASPATGTLRLTVVPWGEIYVDGEKAGIAPPLREVALMPGRHRVEIRNPGFAPHSQAVEVRAGEEIRIRHRFD